MKPGAYLIGGVLLALWYFRDKLPGLFNPASQSNVFNQGANAFYQSVSGNKVDSIGTALYGVVESVTGGDPNAWTPEWTGQVRPAEDASYGAGVFDVSNPGVIYATNQGGAVTGRTIKR